MGPRAQAEELNSETSGSSADHRLRKQFKGLKESFTE